ncbi:FAD-dependent monooxygenase [Rhodoplanes sp. Z2-YC6860]|uniref:FAD-dependent monooxygenase n=1 Tax=Rhodoplanes sp. Z2-YC6860 TaxID=674703 RepID=UPI00078EEA9A|nr:FAD-dependent monooxygenase [Rhodoplanes sp. Z2-YC6860]AMN45063.1 2-polyprenyl-6-methoxyphenol hydroxylase [Rhodoplanes sp. Z2-YC6860]
MGDIRRVLVVGGGVGGLTAAATFARRGMETVLIERRPAFDIPGIGLGQPANALRVYDTLGVLDQILDTGFSYNEMWLFDRDRRLIVEHKFQMGDDRVPAFCALSRLQLHEILLGAAQRAGAEIRLGTTVSEIHEEKDRVHVVFSTGKRETFDLVAGFDGIRSQFRQHLYGTAFVPRPSGYGAWRVQVPRPDCVRGMEFLQGIGGKTGAMPLSNDVMYLFHIRPEAVGANFAGQDYLQLFRDRLAQYGSYVREILASLTADSDIVYSPIEPMMLPWPWSRGRVVIGGDAAHTVSPHLTQGAAMAAEDAYVLVREVLNDDVPVEDRLVRYAMKRYPRCAFVYTFSGQWLLDEQSVRSEEDLEAARIELTANASARIGASDRLLDGPI